MVVGGEAAPSQEGGFEAERGGVAAMCRLGHRAGVGEHRAGARGGDADRVGEGACVELQQMARSDGGAERPHHARRVEDMGVERRMTRSLADPALDLDPLHQRGDNVST